MPQPNYLEVRCESRARGDAAAPLRGLAIREPSTGRALNCFRIIHIVADVEQVQDADKLFQASEQQIQTVLDNVDGAINFIVSAEKDHPNRVDIVQMSNSGTGQNTNAFSQGSPSNQFQLTPSNVNAFGAPSQQATTSAFGAPSTGAFGQPSALGQKPNPFGAPTQSFGAPSQLGAAGAFGSPSALGQKPNPFGAPSGGSGPTSAPFSSFATNPNPFAKAPQAASSNAFGAASQPAQANPFGQPSGQSPNPFQSSDQPSHPNPFGNTSSMPFGAPSPAGKNPFGAADTQPPAPNPFGATAAPPNPFGAAPTTAAVVPNPFGNPQPNPPATNTFGGPSNGLNPIDPNPFGNPQPAAPANPLGNAPQPYQPVVNGDAGVHPPLNTYASKGPNGKLTMFKGRRVDYRDNLPGFLNADGSWERIWNPEGPPPPYKDTQLPDSDYDDSTEAAYMHLRQTGSFPEGAMPTLPPKREWCLWDF